MKYGGVDKNDKKWLERTHALCQHRRITESCLPKSGDWVCRAEVLTTHTRKTRVRDGAKNNRTLGGCEINAILFEIVCGRTSVCAYLPAYCTKRNKNTSLLIDHHCLTKTLISLFQ